ncbi:MAG: hypothetical protein WD005_00940 [Haliea sp.]
MASLTISVDDETLRRARIRAATTGVSLNTVLREYLEAYAGKRQDQQQAVHRLLELARTSQFTRGDRTWTRDELYERH